MVFSFATLSLVVYFLGAFAGLVYGANIDRFAMVLGALPGLVGLLGFMQWAAVHGDDYSATIRKRQSKARRNAMRARLARSY